MCCVALPPMIEDHVGTPDVRYAPARVERYVTFESISNQIDLQSSMAGFFSRQVWMPFFFQTEFGDMYFERVLIFFVLMLWTCDLMF